MVNFAEIAMKIMKMMLRPYIFRLLPAVVLTVVLFACGKRQDGFEALPCREKSDGWMLMRGDGTLIDAKFDHRPSTVREGRFWVRNEEGYWQLYGCDDNDKVAKISDKEYRTVSNFFNGTAFVAERNCPVSVIDKDGTTKVVLDTVGGAVPYQFLYPTDGMLTVVIDTLRGVIDSRGETVVPVKYGDIGPVAHGRILASRNVKLDAGEFDFTNAPAEASVMAFDYQGNLIFKLAKGKYDLVASSFLGEYLPVGNIVGDDTAYGLLDGEGREVLPLDKDVHEIVDVRGNSFIYEYYDSKGKSKSGVRSVKDGAIIIAPRYDRLFYLDHDHLCAGVSESDASGIAYSIINLKGEVTAPGKYLDVVTLDGRTLFAQTAPQSWDVIDYQGNVRSDSPRLTALYTGSFVDAVLFSDYIDPVKLIQLSQITPYSLGKITFGLSAREVVAMQGGSVMIPAAYKSTDEFNMFPIIDGELVSETVFFPGPIGIETYREEQVVDFTLGFKTWYRTERVPTGYGFSQEKPRCFRIAFNNYGRLRGRLRLLFNELVKHFSTFGNVADHNGGATVVNLGGGKKAVVMLKPNSVEAIWGDLTVNELAIHPYKGNVEQLSDMFADEGEE